MCQDFDTYGTNKRQRDARSCGGMLYPPDGTLHCGRIAISAIHCEMGVFFFSSQSKERIRFPKDEGKLSVCSHRVYQEIWCGSKERATDTCRWTLLPTRAEPFTEALAYLGWDSNKDTRAQDARNKSATILPPRLTSRSAKVVKPLLCCSVQEVLRQEIIATRNHMDCYASS